VTLPGSVTEIRGWTFKDCRGLTSFTISGSVTAIGGYAFYNCSRLTSVTVPGSVTTIGEGAFFECGSLASVTIPNSVTTIGRYAFYNCSSLTSVTVGWTTPLSIEGDAFNNVPLSSCTLHVPTGTKTFYETADVWKGFGNILEDAEVGTE
jgi:hypothetical protein